MHDIVMRLSGGASVPVARRTHQADRHPIAMTASNPLITCTPGIRSGKACMSGARVSVSDVLGYLASGMSQEEILTDFPDLQPEHIQAVLRVASPASRSISDQQ